MRPLPRVATSARSGRHGPQRGRQQLIRPRRATRPQVSPWRCPPPQQSRAAAWLGLDCSPQSIPLPLIPSPAASMEVLRRRDGEFILWRNISPTLYFSLLQGRRSSFPSETATKFAAVESSPPGPFLAGLCSSLIPLHGSLLQQPLSYGSLVGREKDEGVYHLGGSSRGGLRWRFCL